jgi:hypothetical protein
MPLLQSNRTHLHGYRIIELLAVVTELQMRCLGYRVLERVAIVLE